MTPQAAFRFDEVAIARMRTPRLFDWARECREDVDGRQFPAVVGPGRGEPLTRHLMFRRLGLMPDRR